MHHEEAQSRLPAERSPEYVRELAAHHVGGQLSVAPEHVSPRVLEKMKKPGIERR